MFELSNHRSSFNIENLRYTSGRLTTIHEFHKYRKLLQQRYRSYQSNRSSTAVDQNDSNAFSQIVSLVPDEVLYHSEDSRIRTFEAAVLFADISGFTDLSDRYQKVENGASKLSMVLNFYLGIMVQEILSHNGDIIKYAGDAFLAVFRSDKSMSMQNSVQNAIDTAIIIQNNCRDYVTDIGVVLNVKIAISCGQVDFSLIGDELSSHYVCVGDPVWEVKALQELISPGEILLAWKGWYYTQEGRYTHQAVREHRCYKINGFKEQLNIIRQQYEATLNFQEMQRNLNRNMESNSVSNLMVETSVDAFTLNYSVHNNDIFSLRPINERLLAHETKRRSLRRFVIKPLLNAIDLNESVDSLIEMRNVVIVFANVIPTRTDSKNLIKITDKIYKKLSSIVHAYEGTLNKVSLFDKDMMLLSIFGLRGFQHENDSEIGLRCAHELHETLRGWSGVSQISIGVTTGKSYCGVVGHTLRREYSVISVTVNKAARLMMTYPNIVSCDQETLIQSKMNLKLFTQLPKRALKGIRGQKPVYEFRDVIDFDKWSFSSAQDLDKIYGRDELLRWVQYEVASSITGNFNRAKTHPKPCILIKAEMQEGKTTVINKLFRDFHKSNLRCVRLMLNTKHASMHFWVIKYLAKKIFNCNKNYEDLVLQKLSQFHVQDYLFLLNEIFDTRFVQRCVIDKRSLKCAKHIQQLLLTVLFKQSPNLWIVLIDDADFIDSFSMNFLNSIMASQAIYFILTVGKQQKRWTLQQRQFYRDVTLLHCLEPIDKTFHKDIACQSINVAAIPIEFERFLQQKSAGNPGWIETCAKTLLYSGKLIIKSLTVMRAVADGMILKSDLLTRDESEVGGSGGNFFDIVCTQTKVARTRAVSRGGDDETIDVAVLESELKEKDYVVNFNKSKLMLYDSLSSHEQEVCKCASVLGPEFERATLNYLLPNSNLRLTGKTIVKLFQLNILYCAATREKHDDAMWAIKNEVISCNCSNIEILESCRDLPKYASCALLTFRDETFRKYIYDTLTEKQLREYHKRCTIFLYRNNKNCSQCGSEGFEIIDEIKLNYQDGFVKSGSHHDRVRFNMLKELKVRMKNIDDRCCEKRLRIFPFVPNYLNYDFRSCKCDQIIASTLTQIIDHCQGKENIIRKIYSQVIFADISIKTANIPRAIELLREALDKLQNASYAFEEKVLFFVYLQGRVAFLSGVSAESTGQRDEALAYYYEACDIFQIPFPSRYNFKAKMQMLKLVYDLKASKTFCKVPPLTRIQTMIKQQSAIVLQKLCEFYIQTRDMKMAQLAAMWSLKKALTCKNHTNSIACCFKNLLRVSSPSSSCLRSLYPVFNIVFKTLCYRSLDKESLEEICSLYTTIMEYQICRNEVMMAIEIGRYAKRISYQMTSKKFLITLTPILFYALAKIQQTQECCTLLQEFCYSTRHTNNVHALSWYYALCMDLILETNSNEGIVEYDACRKHLLERQLSGDYDNYSEAYARFLANFWLWNLRIGHVDSSRLLLSSVLGYYREEAGLCNFLTGIRIIDGLNLQLWNAIRLKNLFEYHCLADQATSFMRRLRKQAKSHYPCLVERLELCKIRLTVIRKLNPCCRQHQLVRLRKQALKRKDYHTANQVERLISYRK